MSSIPNVSAAQIASAQNAASTRAGLSAEALEKNAQGRHRL